MLVAQLCSILCEPMDCSPPGSSIHGILQARILEEVAIPFSRGSSWPRDQTWVSCTADGLFTIWLQQKRYRPKGIYLSLAIFKMWNILNDIFNIYLKCGTFLSHKIWNLAIFNNMDGPIGHYAKWNKSDREIQTLYDFTYLWNPKNRANE